MTRIALALAIQLAVASGAPALLIAGACSAPTSRQALPPQRGGTLRVSLSSGMNTDQTMLDPQLEYDPGAFELFRCCLLRTLLSYEGKPTDAGGTRLRPDLATDLPAVSADELTWTFHLRSGIHYSPPFQRVTVTSGDFVRAVERQSRLGVGAVYLNVITGFDAYTAQKASGISGIETPDQRTLVFHLTQPTGDFAYRMALPYLGPIPPSPADSSAQFGAATGHDAGDGGFLVSTGPYMLAGLAQVDFRLPPGRQTPASGWLPGKSIRLVRNPSWHARTDPLRPAYAERIQVTYVGGANFGKDDRLAVQAVAQGDADVENLFSPSPQMPESLITQRRSLIHRDLRSVTYYISMSLAVPPLDDLHVRKAVNWVLDKAAVRAAGGGAYSGDFAGHIGPDVVEDNALVGYDPYHTDGEHGDLAAAKREMASSGYDADGDGICDGPRCRNLPALAIAGFAGQTSVIVNDLAAIGLQVKLVTKPLDQFFTLAADPTQHFGMVLMTGWGADYPDGSNFFVPLFQSGQSPGSNASLVGSTPDSLSKWGYSAVPVPSVDDRIATCLAGPGWQQTPCWVRLDEYLMEKVVPWVPVFFDISVELVSPNVARYSYDASTTEPALDQIALKR